jgi:hypothetical protein
MKCTEQQAGTLLMFAGLSKRIGEKSISTKALTRWVDEESLDGSIERATIWLFRTGYISSDDGRRFVVTPTGWEVVDQIIKNASDEPSPSSSDTEEHADVYLLIGEFKLKVAAQKLTQQVFGDLGADKSNRRDSK